eukprot:CAMPEP_0170470788 /NCGR_PEP_ID=MMETSP0123-20130129/13152_1 /TAXON_ID=182087 /ORGANISM="Favella ehrenbergii, Strain Fehren 1" /LENGTH=45 /DNA_ID= /DNA_START= /DNA_END= /DNA_ORIENTATION=
MNLRENYGRLSVHSDESRAAPRRLAAGQEAHQRRGLVQHPRQPVL